MSPAPASAEAAVEDFARWLSAEAEGLDTGAASGFALLPRLAAAGLPGAGVPRALGGAGGDVIDGVAAIAETAEMSLAAAFALWGHRSYIEYLLQSPDRVLEERHLKALLAGEVAGATGLSNAMKNLAGLEPLQISARSEGEALVVDGVMPWVTNLRPEGFLVAAAADCPEGGPSRILSFSSGDLGLERSADLDLMALRATNTAAVKLTNLRIGRDRVIADNAAAWLPRVRPAFAGLQCGMSIGLARKALAEASAAAGGSGRGVLGEPIAEARRRLDRAQTRLFAGLRARDFEADAGPLFELRIELAEIVAEAAGLELQALGGRAYLAGPGRDFARRWREAAFIPVVTPSLVQLKAALLKRKQAA